MKYKILICLFLFVSSVLFAQSAAEAERLFNAKQYTKAKTIYESLLKSKPADALFSYRLARCYFELKDWDNAIRNFEISGTKFPLTQWYLAEAFFNLYRFEEAVVAFDNFISTLTPDDKRIPQIEMQKKRAVTAARLLNRVEDISITDSVVTDKSSFLKKIDLPTELGVLRQIPLKRGNNYIADKITYTTQRGDRQIFSDTVAGKTDIFSTFRLFDQWSEPTSISDAVNTTENENYPFLLPDGLTLYFASDGENSIGGYDIFVTRYSSVSQGFLNPENVGFPFNSPANDYMMAIDELHDVGWFATDRNQPAGKVVVYKFVYKNEKNIYHTENPDTLKLAASLRMYRKAPKNQITLQQNIISEAEQADKAFSFIVTDNLTYTSYEDFQNPTAMSLWQEYQKMRNNYNQLKRSLDELRNELDRSGSIIPETVQKILQNEKELNELIPAMEAKLMQVRNEEIIFIRQKKQN